MRRETGVGPIPSSHSWHVGFWNWPRCRPFHRSSVVDGCGVAGPWDDDSGAWRVPLHTTLHVIVARFPTVSKLALKCDYRVEGVANPTFVLLVDRLNPTLQRLKLRSLRLVTDYGVVVLAVAATSLRKLHRLMHLWCQGDRGRPPLLPPTQGALRQCCLPPPGQRG
uniref:Uncharacterized protein n=1 Tax=Oryza glaberrima TaxID=4538 RepID=I1PDM3_ORYGL